MKHLWSTGKLIALMAGLAPALSWTAAGSIAVLACASDAFAQSTASTPVFLEHSAVTPPLLLPSAVICTLAPLPPF